ncbi:reverse transcriptase domain-containing protein [Tanacetum coccineum]|uniref:Reverse transcriptase domain-containing protein n=1 Tax=Tanacetum coccineum TaxID=301880 RepID=A0ABQ5EMN6_9ASTR
MVDPSVPFLADDPTKLMVLVSLVDALSLSNPILETDIQEKEQKESQKQTNPSTGRKGPDQVECMRTRSQARRLRQLHPQQQQVPPNLVEPPKDTMADNRTMAELLQAPTEGYEDAIVVPEIAAANFEIKHGLLTLVQNKQFFGHDKEDPHAHIRYFNKITSTLRYPNVPTTSIKLMLFPFSLEGAARIWLEKERKRTPSINSDMGNTSFKLLDKRPADCSSIIESKSKVRHSRSRAIVAKVSMSASTFGVSPDVAELKYMVRALLLDKQASPFRSPLPYKAVEQSLLPAVGCPNHIVIVRLPMATSTEITFQIRSLSSRTNYTQGNSGIPSCRWQTKSAHPVFLPCHTTASQHQNLVTKPIPWEWLQPGSNPTTPEINECLALADLGASINLMPLSIWKELSLPALTKTRMILELADRMISTPTGIAEDVFVKVGTFFFPTDFVVVDYVIDEFLEHDDSIPPVLKASMILGDIAYLEELLSGINKDLNLLRPPFVKLCACKDEDKTALIKVLKSHKQAIAWKISDIKGIDPHFCTHKILMEENGKPVVQHQRRVNPKIHEVIKQEVIKLLDAGLIYPISDTSGEIPAYRVLSKSLVIRTIRSQYLLAKQDAKPRLLRWILLLQEFDVVIRDKKGAENLAADHLSRLENPHQSELEKKEISINNFLSRQLGMVSFRGKKLLTFLKLATVDPLGDTTVPITPLKRSSIQVSISPRSTRMPTTMSPDVTFVNVKAKFRNVMRCHKTLSKFAKSLTYGALILWGRSRLIRGTNIYSWPLIIYQNGLKRKRSPPMTPELFANFLNLSSPDLVPLVQS